jgi:two-component system KDP operon response regulator KdpE
VTDHPRVLVVDDEAPMRRFLKASLEAHGYRVLLADTLREARTLATSEPPDVVLLDLGLPDGDGIDFTRWLREWSARPVIILSARGLERDKVVALDAGADDYLTKPFGVPELLARMRVALRRTHPEDAGHTELVVGGLHVDLARRNVRLDGRELSLTPIEYRLMVMLARHAGRVLTHRQILAEVWGPTYVHQTHYVRVHMAELRKKVEPEPARPRHLVTEQGVGYRWADDVDAAP